MQEIVWNERRPVVQYLTSLLWKRTLGTRSRQLKCESSLFWAANVLSRFPGPIYNTTAATVLRDNVVVVVVVEFLCGYNMDPATAAHGE